MSWVPQVLKPERYEAVIHGMWSDTVTPLTWVRFKTEEEADLWVQKMNAAHNEAMENPLTMYDYREIGND